MDAAVTRAALARAPVLNDRHLHALLVAAGSQLERVLHPDLLRGIDLPTATREYLAAPDLAACNADVEWLERTGARLILHGEAGYPPLLATIPSPPVALFVLGDPAVLLSLQLAIVGSRNPTHGGRSTARAFATHLAGAGLTITSGLAVGIDAVSHVGALLAGGRTVAVCGAGLDTVYPHQHANLALRIRERGALVSEFPPRTPPRRMNFPRRNRLISGLSLGTLVVEAALQSGSLKTAACAARQGRKVFAIPGPIHSPLARGCHKLIRAGASLVEAPRQVLSELNFSLTGEGLAHNLQGVGRRCVLDNEYEMLLDALAHEPATVDLLALRMGLSCESVASILLILELEGRVAPHPGGTYGPLS